MQVTELDDRERVISHGPFRLLRRRVVIPGKIITKKDKFICSGTVIDNYVKSKDDNVEVILTANHCDNVVIRDGLSVTTIPSSVLFKDGDIGIVRDEVNDIISDDNDDLLIMKVHSKRLHNYVNLNVSRLGIMEDLFGIGGPNGHLWSVIRVSAISGSSVYSYGIDYPGWGHVNLIEAPAMDHGISGGGVFDSDGNLVGVMVGETGSKDINIMIPSSRVREWMRFIFGGDYK